ncbi:MAG: hypothetical protein ACLQU4_19365 [Limisphaerales bacterium]
MNMDANSQPDNGKAKGRGPLPFMKSIAEAKAACERDPFYLDAFMFEAWLGNVVLAAAAEYAEKKNAKDRAMQTGQAWHIFIELFGHAKNAEFHRVLQSLYRFTQYEDPLADILCRAIVPLSFEHECFSDYLGPKTRMDMVKRPAEVVKLMRRTVERWCDWIDALIHFQTHASWHLQPVKFDPDPDKRELAALGINQRNFADMDDFAKNWWQWHHGEAAERFKESPKWSTLGKAMASDRERIWSQPDLDISIISIWPLLKLQNWTYRDLMAVARMILPAPHRYPLEGEQELATYCQNVLGLRKSGATGRSSPDGKPRGWEVALKLCPKRAGPS